MISALYHRVSQAEALEALQLKYHLTLDVSLSLSCSFSLVLSLSLSLLFPSRFVHSYIQLDFPSTSRLQNTFSRFAMMDSLGDPLGLIPSPLPHASQPASVCARLLIEFIDASRPLLEDHPIVQMPSEISASSAIMGEQKSSKAGLVVHTPKVSIHGKFSCNYRLCI